MNKTSTILVLALVLFAAQAEKIQDINYNHYLLQRQWVPTMCIGKHCTGKYMEDIPPESFNMHGLWPTGKPDDVYFQWHDCRTGFKYQQNLIESRLLQWMSENFTGLYSSTESFRAHEYTKHGSCYNYPEGMDDPKEFHNTYFDKIRELKDEYNLVEAFKAAGIEPSNTHSYSANQFVSAIMEAFPSKSGKSAIPQVYCLNKGGRQILKGVNMCYDLEFNFITCPTKGRSLCSPNKRVYLPPFADQDYASPNFLE